MERGQKMSLALLENGLVNIYQNDKQEKLVDARELHEFLGVSTRYNDWIRSRIEKYGFVENLDYVTITENLVNGGRRYVHVLKMDMAKELAMVENNAKGRLARRYFIEVEKKYRQLMDISNLSPELQMFNHMFEAVANIEISQKQLEDQVNTIKDTIVTRDKNWRKDVNKKLRKIGFKNGNYEEIIKESYKLLEERAGCNLNVRLENLRKRMAAEGATKTSIRNANYLDVIDADKRLTEIYINIVNQLYIKHAA